MKITKKLNQFVVDVATIAAATESDENYKITFSEYLKEYKDQIETDDYLCVVTYANDIGISVPDELKRVLKNK